jgi:hypothetical protein
LVTELDFLPSKLLATNNVLARSVPVPLLVWGRRHLHRRHHRRETLAHAIQQRGKPTGHLRSSVLVVRRSRQGSEVPPL